MKIIKNIFLIKCVPADVAERDNVASSRTMHLQMFSEHLVSCGIEKSKNFWCVEELNALQWRFDYLLSFDLNAADNSPPARFVKQPSWNPFITPLKPFRNPLETRLKHARKQLETRSFLLDKAPCRKAELAVRQWDYTNSVITHPKWILLTLKKEPNVNLFKFSFNNLITEYLPCWGIALWNALRPRVCGYSSRLAVERFGESITLYHSGYHRVVSSAYHLRASRALLSWTFSRNSRRACRRLSR